MDKTNVSVVIKSLGLGGAERLIVDSLPYLDRERFTYRFAYITPWKDTLASDIRREGFEVVCLGETIYPGQAFPHAIGSQYVPARSARALSLLPMAYRRLEQWMRNTDCHLLQADLPAAGIIARLAGRRNNVPVVYTEHNLQERYHPLTRRANAATYGQNALVFAVSEEVAESIRRNGLDQHTDVRTLLNGVPVESLQATPYDLDQLRIELDLPEGRPVVGAVSVFRPQKRLPDWLAVAARVAAAHEDALFLLVGDGPDMPLIRRLIHEYGLGDRVRLPGFRNDGRRFSHLIDIFLMTSEYEGLPLAMLEAMALGKPVVATAVGGIPEVVTSGCEGLLAPVGGIKAMAAMINALLTNRDAAAEMGSRGSDLVAKRYHTRDRVREMERSYLQLVDQRRTAL